MAAPTRLSPALLSYLRSSATRPLKPPQPCHHLRTLHIQHRLRLRPQCNFHRPPHNPHRTASTNPTPTNPADDPNWISLIDAPVQLIRIRSKHNYLGLLVLGAIPFIAFLLGSWQVQRLRWKNDLIARFEDRLVKPPLPLPPSIDPEVVKEFDYRRVYAYGTWRHDQEILVGPRVYDGAPGYSVITPLERTSEDGRTAYSKILIARGWIAKNAASQPLRRKMSPEALPEGRVLVEGLLREPFKKNMFTPANLPEKGQWYFPEVGEMAAHTGSAGVWVEATMQADLLTAWDKEEKGVPIGRPAEVNLRNNHTQYIFTWYALSLATTIMFWMVVKKPSSAIKSRVKASRSWS